MTLSNRPLLPAGEREDEWDPELIRPWLSMPSWDPETETTASWRDFWNNRLSTRPSSGGGRDTLTLSRNSSSLSGSSVLRPLAPPPSSTALLLKAAADAGGSVRWRQHLHRLHKPRRMRPDEYLQARRGGTVCPAGWRQYKDTLASQLTAPPGGPPYTPSCTTEGGEGGGVSRSVSGSKRCHPWPGERHPGQGAENQHKLPRETSRPTSSVRDTVAFSTRALPFRRSGKA